MALIPRLRPFQQNRISIEQMDLPLNTQVNKLEKIAAPYFRSGYAIDFPVYAAKDAMLKITGPNGKPLPAGTLVSITGKDETFVVAFNGQVYYPIWIKKTRLLPFHLMRTHAYLK